QGATAGVEVRCGPPGRGARPRTPERDPGARRSLKMAPGASSLGPATHSSSRDQGMAEAPARGSSATGDALLLTPGPLTPWRAVKSAVVPAWGRRDPGFLASPRQVLEHLPAIINATDTHVTVPMQGSGTFAVEAMLTTFLPRAGKVL